MNNTWKGIAIAGIWIGVGLIGLHEGQYGALASIMAMLATLAIAMN